MNNSTAKCNLDKKVIREIEAGREKNSPHPLVGYGLTVCTAKLIIIMSSFLE